MSRITAIDPDKASDETRKLFDSAKKKMGGVPNVLRVMGNSQAALKSYLTLGEILDNTAFDTEEREAIALAVAAANDCNYCASAHTAISKDLKVSEQEIEGRLQARADDSRLQGTLQFARAVVDKRGWVTDEDLKQARDAGLDEGEIMDVVAIVILNMLTNYTNHVADTDIDFPQVSVKH